MSPTLTLPDTWRELPSWLSDRRRDEAERYGPDHGLRDLRAVSLAVPGVAGTEMTLVYNAGKLGGQVMGWLGGGAEVMAILWAVASEGAELKGIPFPGIPFPGIPFPGFGGLVCRAIAPLQWRPEQWHGRELWRVRHAYALGDTGAARVAEHLLAYACGLDQPDPELRALLRGAEG